MVFSSFSFLFLFLPVVLAVYFILPGIKAKNAVLCLFSLLFYAWGEPVCILLMLLSILVNYGIGIGMERFPGRKKALLILALAVNLGAIGYFKYSDFLISNLNRIPGIRLPLTGAVLPIGISFYTFQILSYVIDVYRGQSRAQRDLLSLATYISLFPQLVAGPIVRYETVKNELRSRTVTRQDFAEGLSRFLFGLGKKVLIANQMARGADAVFNAADQPGGWVIWLGALLYTMQIYFDFSGYSDMAIGMGRMFGFHFLENFNYPYIAASVTDFWRRWHMSLSGWFREYVYIPLGGNRRGTARQIVNILTVWLLTGLWHGANWNYILWGLFYGGLLILEKFALKRALPHIPGLVRRVAVFIIVMVGWVIFRVEDLSALGGALGRMFSFGGGDVGAFLTAHADALVSLVLLPAALLGCFPWWKRFAARFAETGWFPVLRMTAALAVWLGSVALLLGESYNPFIYFQF